MTQYPNGLKADATHEIVRTTVPTLDAILGHAFEVLDHGFVRVIDYMGDDAAIVQMARTSYGEGTKTQSDDRSLIRYLMRHAHTSPFEGCEIKLHLKMPIFCARQWIRHRMASLNEVSARYYVLPGEFYFQQAERLGRQSKTNKQGTGEGYTADEIMVILDWIENATSMADGAYRSMVDEEGHDVSRELARIVLPTNIYTEFYWKIDLHNLFHFLRLRADAHAQWEIRQYANVICELVKMWLPHAYEAFEDYRLHAVTFSRQEIEVIRDFISEHLDQSEVSRFGIALRDVGVSEREIEEFIAKIEVSA